MNHEIADAIKTMITVEGRTQSWVVEKMNNINPNLRMNNTKFSAITTKKRKMTGDELIAFCKALEINPDKILKFIFNNGNTNDAA